jgi:alpha-tubulin suppressor-like RCC1 family protein
VVAVPEGGGRQPCGVGQLSRSCALTVGERTYCWGRNYQGVERESSLVPVLSHQKGETGLEVPVVGCYIRCGLTVNRGLHCRGDGTYGRLGTGRTEYWTFVSTLTQVLPEKRFASVSPGRNHTCAVTVEGATYCWGLNDRGQLGRDESPGTGWTVPVPVWER